MHVVVRILLKKYGYLSNLQKWLLKQDLEQAE